MKGYACNEVFKPRELDYLRRAEQIVAVLPETEPGTDELLRCHEVARVVAHFLELPVMDGFFCRVDHSWLYFGSREEKPRSLRILDPYSVGRLPIVQLIDCSLGLPYDDNYKPYYPRDDIREAVVEELIQLVASSSDSL